MDKIIKKHLDKILEFIDITPEVKLEVLDNNAFKVDISGSDLSFLIGYRGESLDSLQNIMCQAIFNEMGEWPHLQIDINGYKQSNLEKLEGTVREFIDRVRFHQKEIKLPSLNSYERRHVHNFVSDYTDVSSESRDEGNERILYIKPA